MTFCVEHSDTFDSDFFVFIFLSRRFFCVFQEFNFFFIIMYEMEWHF